MLRALAVLLQRLIPPGFLLGPRKGHIPNLQQLGCGEKRHVRGVVKEGVAKAPLVYQNGTHSSTLRLDGACQASRARANHQYVKIFLYGTAAILHLYSLDDERR